MAELLQVEELLIMQVKKLRPPRNIMDLSDPRQVRAFKKRFRLTEAELAEMAGRAGNSIAAVAKEAVTQRAKKLDQPADVPAAEVIMATDEAVQSPSLCGETTAA